MSKTTAATSLSQLVSSIPAAPIVPPWAQQLLVIEPSGHLDWDWLVTFDQYYSEGGGGHIPVSQIFSNASSLLANNLSYTYSICEQAYLRRFFEKNPSEVATFRGYGARLSISGGGMTSAENLVCHGETFIRNYLAGRHWVRATLGITSVPNLWIPDDFGQDAQLPVVLRAMGYSGVAFWRIPGGDSKSGESQRTAAAPASKLQGNIDFQWSAADQSSVQAHWLWQSYCEGNNDLSNQSATQAIQDMVTTNKDASPAPFLFVPIDCDFNDPDGVSQIIAGVQQWNSDPSYGQANGVYAVLAPFTLFTALVAAYAQSSPLYSFAGPLNPYYSGCYATHPRLKRLHYAATRALLGAEVFERVATLQGGVAALEGARRSIDEAWKTLIPSSHHDYIPGTAVDAVTQHEQGPRLARAREQAVTVRGALMTEIAASLPAVSDAMAVFNSLGFKRDAVVLKPSGVPFFTASVPAMGYSSVVPGQGPTFAPVTLRDENGGWVLANEHLRATFDGNGNLTSVIDVATGQEVLAGGDAVGNQIVFYADSGNVYRFGSEILTGEGYPDMVFQPVSATSTTPVVQRTDNGPLRKGLSVVVSYTPDGASSAVEYTMQYHLVAGERLLRMQLTGAAPSSSTTGYSVMARFPLAAAVTAIVHGTACHWDTGAPRGFYVASAYDTNQQPITFEATHDYLIGQDTSGNALAAIYHKSTPAWGIDPEGALIGCVLRNAYNGPGNAIQGNGEDTAVHTVRYALRVPGKLGPATSGEPLREALAYQTPLFAVAIPSTATGTRDASASLAGTHSSEATITAAKAGAGDPATTVLRVYQPTNGARTIDVTLAPALMSAGFEPRAIDAIEMGPDPDLEVRKTSNGVKLSTRFALSTVALAPAAGASAKA